MLSKLLAIGFLKYAEHFLENERTKCFMGFIGPLQENEKASPNTSSRRTVNSSSSSITLYGIRLMSIINPFKEQDPCRIER